MAKERSHTDKQSAYDAEEAEARETIHRLEQDPPKRLEDWPDDRSKYLTYGGPPGDHGYDEGPERKLGPSELAYHEDGSITIHGEPVENPDDYRGEPIPGGPTDPDAPENRPEGG